jgi:D-arabinose 5-phosphate isomerase GutQ
VPVVVVTAEAGSALASLGDVVVPIWRGYEGWQPSAPMASVIAMMAVSDALVAACGERMGVRDEDIRRRHPAGAIGRAVA